MKCWRQLVNSQCSRVTAADGKVQTGREKLNKIVESLLRNDQAPHPRDFMDLKDMINRRISRPN